MAPLADGERNLDRLIANMRPVLDPADYRFVLLQDVCKASTLWEHALMLFRESEGITLILPSEMGDMPGAAELPRFRRITLTIHSSLEAVGLTAAISTALTRAGISANVVAAFHHDHVFVPAEDAEAALAILQRLSAEAAG
ncbi:ACT domain-containing protein [Marivibrio halodurans]|uniref:ACT domain-containing protein n=1 Tax=Marivibrio halodurans TaxID=2039722 RepID=A0A8J7SJF9_9PROT|nr:ACT domain-containing protein [Marivibrio halodurans]MBP5855603.1 ACT domain-containing protein [Marivibrio halodurans]